jgi:hypothetical protein
MTECCGENFQKARKSQIACPNSHGFSRDATLIVPRPLREDSMLRTLRRAFGLRPLLLVVAAAAFGGCSLNTDVSLPGGLVKYSGDQQTGPANTALPTALGVLVVNQFGERLKNVTVNWSISSGGGSISSATTLSDDSGLASVTYTTGPTAGQAIIDAGVHGVPPLHFNIFIT